MSNWVVRFWIWKGGQTEKRVSCEGRLRVGDFGSFLFEPVYMCIAYIGVDTRLWRIK